MYIFMFSVVRFNLSLSSFSFFVVFSLVKLLCFVCFFGFQMHPFIFMRLNHRPALLYIYYTYFESGYNDVFRVISPQSFSFKLQFLFSANTFILHLHSCSGSAHPSRKYVHRYITSSYPVYSTY